ncbi:SSI family serine proteinase inhibitor [Streptomyces sp. NBC_00893]|uniref:SSI family serine proteinase inhibitor n=1 Tax=Streptomyces sp. NBC_00893 TaxID=2975862 RepID=UPI00224EA023|nr:SSI family serine proteinase inhibitor [Streptomyces sp. NBC_00893]MCX4846617.1 subtilase-type protease inhibitor [Streptomyces sp. NBC_00893]
MLRRSALTAVVSLAALSAVAPAAIAATGPLPLPLPLPVLQDDAGTRLRITVSGSADSAAEGAFELRCAPAGGSHPVAEQACDRLDELAGGRKDPFAPVPADALCTLQSGGPATARVTGTWQGRHIDSVFSRTNGCEISRWNNLSPVLPNVR